MTWPNVRHLKHKTPPFYSQMSKNDIYDKTSIFVITEKWLNIFEKNFIQIGAMYHIYYFYKLKMDINIMWRKSGEREQVSQLAYINRVETT